VSGWRLARIPVALTGTVMLAMGIRWVARSAPRPASVPLTVAATPVARESSESTSQRVATPSLPASAPQPREARRHQRTAVIPASPPTSSPSDSSVAVAVHEPIDSQPGAAVPDTVVAPAPAPAPLPDSATSTSSPADAAPVSNVMPTTRHADGTVPPVLVAEAMDRPIVIDGRLDDSAWARAVPLAALTQSEPDEGKAASESTTVRVVYGEDAIYVGVRLFDATPSRIIRRLGRRDASTHSDAFEVLLDSYHDHRTAYRFAVNAAGVKSDELIGDDGDYSDDSWDPVWETATAIDSLGWSAELRIPFSQLRFSAHREDQVWGVRFVRWIERKNERDIFPFVPRTASGEASHYAHLTGLRTTASPRRGELLPFSVARATYHRPEFAGNPFDGASRYYGSAGVDLKYGVTTSLTMDATVNPDFGQVELDPRYVNLSEFEEFLQERRPFFVEGGEIFGFGGTGGGTNHFSGSPLYFYSRRIGRPPQGSATSDGEFVDMPASTTILGAAKLSGKAGRRWSIGVLDAITAREWATVTSAASGPRLYDEVEPLTNYFTSRVKGGFQGGNTTIGLLGTAVNRDLRTPALDFLRTGAYAGGVDLFHRWGGGHNTYTVAANIGGTYIVGDPAAIQQAQRSSNRYYQRPDAHSFRYDPQRRSLSGVSGELYLNKVAGDWNWGIAGSAVSPGFEVNDLGFQKRVDQLSLAGTLGRKWTRPVLMFRKAYAFVTAAPSWNYDGNPIERKYGTFAYGQFRNFWSASVSGSYSAAVLDDRLTRGGPLARKPASWYASGEGYTDNRKRVSGYAFASFSRTAAGGWSLSVLPQVTIRRGTALSASLGPYYFVGRATAQYLRRVNDTLTGTTRYVFGELRQHEVDVTLRVNAAFSPVLSFQLYAQPFSFAAAYRNFKELRAPRTYDFTVYGRDNGSAIRDTVLSSGSETQPGYVVDPGSGGEQFSFASPDFRTRSLQFKAVLRWEYRPGSTLYVAWTQSRSGYFPVDGTFSLGRDLGRELFRDRPTNVLMVKLNYWMSW
jgi:hypothetical protein